MLAVALLWAAVPASAFAREFRTADTQNGDYPAVQALNCMDRLIAQCTGGRQRIVVTGIYAKVERVRATAAPIERIRNME